MAGARTGRCGEESAQKVSASINGAVDPITTHAAVEGETGGDPEAATINGVIAARTGTAAVGVQRAPIQTRIGTSGCATDVRNTAAAAGLGRSTCTTLESAAAAIVDRAARSTLRLAGRRGAARAEFRTRLFLAHTSAALGIFATPLRVGLAEIVSRCAGRCNKDERGRNKSNKQAKSQ